MYFRKTLAFVFGITLSTCVLASSWQSSKAIVGEDCLSIGGEEIEEFVTKYYGPQLLLSSKNKGSEKSLLQSYAMASSLLTRAQICVVEALEIKGYTDELKKQQKFLTSGTSLNDKKKLKAHRKLSKAVDKKISEALKQNRELQPGQRKKVGVGTSMYTAATYTLTNLTESYWDYVNYLKDNKKSLGNAFSASKKIGGATLLAQGIADLYKSTSVTGKNIYSYSQKNNIEVDSSLADKVGW